MKCTQVAERLLRQWRIMRGDCVISSVSCCVQVMNRCFVTFAIAVIAAGCTDNRSSIPATETTEANQSQATQDEPTMSDHERYDNPVDKKTYVAPSGWREYQPSVPRVAEEKARIHNNGVRLLTAQGEITARTSVESLVAFIKCAEVSAQTTLADVTANATILAQFACSPGKHDVQLAHEGNVSQDQLQSFYDALLALEAMPVTSGEISFQLTIKIDPTN